MRRYRIASLFVLLVLVIAVASTDRGGPTPAAPPAPTPTQEIALTTVPLVVTALRTAEPSVTMWVNVDGLNLRDAPAGRIVGSVQRDTELTVKIAGEWAEVTQGLHKGKFVAAKWLRPAK